LINRTICRPVLFRENPGSIVHLPTSEHSNDAREIRSQPFARSPEMKEPTMEHVFKVGELVRTKGLNADRTGGVYEVVRLMPSAPDNNPLYRVARDGRERVLGQSEIESA
jgi:hypothetical protein